MKIFSVLLPVLCVSIMVNFKHIAQPMGEVLQMHKGIKNREMVGNHDYALNPDGSGAGENIFWLRPVFRL